MPKILIDFSKPAAWLGKVSAETELPGVGFPISTEFTGRKIESIGAPPTWVRGDVEVRFYWRHGTICTTDWERVNDSGKEDSTK